MRLFNDDGTIRLTDERGKPKKKKIVNKKNEGIEICLNCKKKKCNGYCNKFKEEKKNANK